MHFLLQKPDYMIRLIQCFQKSFSLKSIYTIQHSAYYAEAIKFSFANFFHLNTYRYSSLSLNHSHYIQGA